jgi:hypothetical protein
MMYNEFWSIYMRINNKILVQLLSAERENFLVGYVAVADQMEIQSHYVI